MLVVIDGAVRGRPFREVPIYRETTCEACGADDSVAVRYGGTVLCLDCYRRAKRDERDDAREVEAFEGDGT